jgi:hypothetical protein
MELQTCYKLLNIISHHFWNILARHTKRYGSKHDFNIEDFEIHDPKIPLLLTRNKFITQDLHSRANMINNAFIWASSSSTSNGLIDVVIEELQNQLPAYQLKHLFEAHGFFHLQKPLLL